MPDAVSRTSREWEVGVWMPLGAVLRQEPLWNEAIGVREYLGIPVQEKRGHDHICSGGNQFIFDNDVLTNDSANK